MAYTVHFHPVVPRSAVSIHAWEEMSGQIWDLEGVQKNGTFDFQLDIHSHDLRQIQFKYRFPLENDLWESDDFIRRLPDSPTDEVWTFGFSARCMTEAPGTAADLDTIKVTARSHQEYRSGKLYAWNPAGNQSVEVPESAREDADDSSEFKVPFRDWMADGFSFKLKDSSGNYEPDRAIKVWRAVDGADVYIKSRQFVVRKAPFALIQERIDLVRPQAQGAQQLQVLDPAGDDSRTYQPDSVANLDNVFVKETYQLRLYQDCLYSLKVASENDTCWRVVVASQGDASFFTVIHGERRWFPTNITRSATATIFIHPNQKTAFSGDLEIRPKIGAGAAYETVTAKKQVASWKADLKVFPGACTAVDIVSPTGVVEAREDGNFSRVRSFTVTGDVVLHTVDGISGFCNQGKPSVKDVAAQKRRDLMAAVFSPTVVSSGVFDSWELPHGANVIDGQTWFVVKAPHAVRSRLLVLDGEGADKKRIVTEHEMSLTPDLRYWWIALDDAGHGTEYRFLFNDEQESVDPAARLLNGAGRVWAQPGEGKDGPWSIVVDRARIDSIFAGSQWKTMGWEAHLIYELHPLRLTKRNNQNAFKSVQTELDAGGYFDGLGIKTLELLPVNEYPKVGGWGYDPCAYFSIESGYGGPEEFARLVRKAHDTGRGVMIDVVYNHMGSECPLYAVGVDMYGDGKTEWGAMVDFDNPPVIEFFRQALLHLWQAYHLDGFRFDSTRTIVEGRCKTPGCVVEPGSGGGWEFLGQIFAAINKAADATGSPWPYLVAENDPINDGLSNASRPHVMDGQWHFAHHYDLASAAFCKEDKSYGICANMDYPHNQLRPFCEAVRYGESHDSTSEQEDWKRRIVARTPYDQGYLMSKAVGAAGILAKGVPMIFMGQEAGEHLPFLFGMDNLNDDSRYQRLDDYGKGDNKTIMDWFNSVMAFRNNPGNGFRGDDDQRVSRGNNTVAFTRGWGKFFVIATFGTPDTVQNLGWLGLPAGTYKEVLNSSWPVFNVKYEPQHANGGYDARLRATDNVNLPPVGAVILERL